MKQLLKRRKLLLLLVTSHQLQTSPRIKSFNQKLETPEEALPKTRKRKCLGHEVWEYSSTAYKPQTP